MNLYEAIPQPEREGYGVHKGAVVYKLVAWIVSRHSNKSYTGCNCCTAKAPVADSNSAALEMGCLMQPVGWMPVLNDHVRVCAVFLLGPQ